MEPPIRHCGWNPLCCRLQSSMAVNLTSDQGRYEDLRKFFSVPWWMLWWGNYISSFSFFFSLLKWRRWVVTDYFLFFYNILLFLAGVVWTVGGWEGGGRVQLFCFGGLLNEGGGIFFVLFHFSARNGRVQPLFSFILFAVLD